MLMVVNNWRPLTNITETVRLLCSNNQRDSSRQTWWNRLGVQTFNHIRGWRCMVHHTPCISYLAIHIQSLRD